MSTVVHLELWVPGIPRPQGSKRAIVNRHTGRAALVEDSKGVQAWRSDVRDAAAKAWETTKPLLDGPLVIDCMFIFPWRKSDLRKDGTPNPGASPWKISKPDVSKLLRAVEDALTGIVYTDDARLVEVHPSKRYGDRPGVHIILREYMPLPAIEQP